MFGSLTAVKVYPIGKLRRFKWCCIMVILYAYLSRSTESSFNAICATVQHGTATQSSHDFLCRFPLCEIRRLTHKLESGVVAEPDVCSSKNVV